jgi:hypothetical protein
VRGERFGPLASSYARKASIAHELHSEVLQHELLHFQELVNLVATVAANRLSSPSSGGQTFDACARIATAVYEISHAFGC